ncbi:GH39 family glycosyl hydrolase [Kribbella sp. CA-245084]|uniref:GH39 family glycosyl hydrolase n=1 Tax=Kribbella sp. CA-245084 TaxID=3239940 RepID=UPI003D92AA6C
MRSRTVEGRGMTIGASQEELTQQSNEHANNDALPLVLTVEARAAGRVLDPYWRRVVGAGRAAEALRADWQQHLRLVRQHCGFEYVRFHGLFHDDMFVYRTAPDGSPVYTFQYVDSVFDALLDSGVRPFVEFGFSPRDLAREKETVFWWGGHGSPPVDLERWADLVSEICRHWIARYGTAEVRQWLFEVWNEPNLAPFFRGTKSEYFALYAATARAVKEVDPLLRIGGPSTSNFVPDRRFAGETEDISQHTIAGAASLDTMDFQPVWIEDFLRYAQEHGLPVDFVSCHPYPTDWALDRHGQGAQQTRGVDATPRDLQRLRALIDDCAFPAAEIHLTEWSSSSSSRDHAHDQLPAATFVVRSVLEGAGQVDSLAYWTFTDVFEEEGAGEELFHGGFGMVTLSGVVKPTFHAFRMLNALGPEEVARTPGAIATRHEGGGIAVLAYHYPSAEQRSVPASFDGRETADRTAALGTPRPFRLQVTDLPAGVEVQLDLLDAVSGNALEAWRRLGAPPRPDRSQLNELRIAAMATRRWTCRTDPDGRLDLSLELPPWSVLLVTTDATAGGQVPACEDSVSTTHPKEGSHEPQTGRTGLRDRCAAVDLGPQ